MSTDGLECNAMVAWVTRTLDMEESLVRNRETALRVVKYFLLER